MESVITLSDTALKGGRNILEIKRNKNNVDRPKQLVGRLGNFILMVDGKGVQGSG